MAKAEEVAEARGVAVRLLGYRWRDGGGRRGNALGFACVLAKPEDGAGYGVLKGFDGWWVQRPNFTAFYLDERRGCDTIAEAKTIAEAAVLADAGYRIKRKVRRRK